MLDENKNPLRVIRLDAVRGVNAGAGTLMVEQTLALKAEQTARAKAKGRQGRRHAGQDAPCGGRALQQRSSSRRGIHPAPEPGAVSSETTLEVKAPEAQGARQAGTQPARPRHVARLSAEAAAKPYAEERAEMAAGL